MFVIVVFHSAAHKDDGDTCCIGPFPTMQAALDYVEFEARIQYWHVVRLHSVFK